MQDFINILGLLFAGLVIYTLIVPPKNDAREDSIRLFGKGD